MKSGPVGVSTAARTKASTTRIAEMPDEAARGNQAELGEEHHHDGQLKDQAEGNHQPQAERDVVADRQVCGDVVAGEAEQEGHHERQKEIEQRPAGVEQGGGADQKWNGVLALVRQ